MTEFLIVLNAVLPIVALAVAGIVLRRLNWLTEDADRSLLRLNVNVLSPCLIFDKVLGNDAVRRLDNLVLAPLVGFGTITLGLVVALLCAGMTGLTRIFHTFADVTRTKLNVCRASKHFCAHQYFDRLLEAHFPVVRKMPVNIGSSEVLAGM